MTPEENASAAKAIREAREVVAGLSNGWEWYECAALTIYARKDDERDASVWLHRPSGDVFAFCAYRGKVTRFRPGKWQVRLAEIAAVARQRMEFRRETQAERDREAERERGRAPDPAFQPVDDAEPERAEAQVA